MKSEIRSEQIWLTESGQKILFQLVQKSQARRVYLKISLDNGLEIIIPRRFSMDKIPDILREKELWILKNLQKINERQKSKKALEFKEGAFISILGIEKIISFYNNHQKRAFVEESDQEVKIYKNESSASHKNILEKYLRTKAKIYFLERTKSISLIMGLGYNKISVRAQKSRWGSCSRRKNLNFNWHLILTPPEVVDYVIVHELAHTVHLNHSKRFYDLVENFCPQYKHLRAFLRKAEFVM